MSLMRNSVGTCVSLLLLAGCGGGGENVSQSAGAASSAAAVALQVEEVPAITTEINLQVVQFDAGSVGSGTVVWDYGDGSTGSGATSSHTYAAAGVYVARMKSTVDGTVKEQTARIAVPGVKTGFERAVVNPLSVCTTQSPNYVTPVSLADAGLTTTANSGGEAMKVHWSADSYNGTRMTKGAEACAPMATNKEAWIGFSFYLPSNGYPTDKTAGMFQMFESGGCSSWGGLMSIVGNDLKIQHRNSCGTATDVTFANGLPRDTWIPILVHMVASHTGNGLVEIWYGGAPKDKPSYRASGINFGFGTWNSDDTLASGSEINFKFGQYDYDVANYTAGETRTSYYDNIHILQGNPDNAWQLVNPQASISNSATATITASAQPHTDESAAMAFDGDVETKWFSDRPTGWLQYALGDTNRQVLTSYAVTSANDAPTRDPKDWQLLASNDGVQWTVLDSRSGQAFLGRHVSNQFPVDNIAAYAYYRLGVTANNGNASELQLAEVGLGFSR